TQWNHRMECSQCRHVNPPGTKFCGECGTRLQTLCPACRTANPPTNKFCSECGQRLTGAAAAPAATAPASPVAAATPVAPAATSARFASPEAYTPRHLAEKILTSKGAIEGERKVVTVMFSDVSGFTAMSEKLDPEDVHAIMDRVFEVILEAVHRYEGTVNQFLRDGALRGADRARGSRPARAERGARDSRGAQAARRGCQARPRHRVPDAHGHQHRPRGRRRHRTRSSYGLHGGRRHHQPRRAAAR